MKSKTNFVKQLLLAGAATVFMFTFLVDVRRRQELRGKISGRVVDPNGAAVPGASVKVIDLARNNTTTLTTNDEGLFTAPIFCREPIRCWSRLPDSRNRSRTR